MIPKIIHYCWLSDDPIPCSLEKYMQSWKEKLLDYEFILWNFDHFDKEKSLWVKQAFEAKKYAFAADYIRLFAVYNYGGIYMDMDIEVIKPFNELLDNSIILGYENKDKNGFEAGCFGAEKENRFIGNCLKYYENRNFIRADGSFDMLPLPKILFSIYGKTGCTFSLFPYEYFTAKSWNTGDTIISPNTFTIHHFAWSWGTQNQQKFNLIRRKCIKMFGQTIGSIISFPLSLLCQIQDNGLNKTARRYFHKISELKRRRL